LIEIITLMGSRIVDIALASAEVGKPTAGLGEPSAGLGNLSPLLPRRRRAFIGDGEFAENNLFSVCLLSE
jgi:hypothetical protein